MKAINYAMNEVDVIVTTGSVSMGDKDMLKQLLTDLGATILFGNYFFIKSKIYKVWHYFQYRVFRSRKYETRKTNNICNDHMER